LERPPRLERRQRDGPPPGGVGLAGTGPARQRGADRLARDVGPGEPDGAPALDDHVLADERRDARRGGRRAGGRRGAGRGGGAAAVGAVRAGEETDRPAMVSSARTPWMFFIAARDYLGGARPGDAGGVPGGAQLDRSRRACHFDDQAHGCPSPATTIRPLTAMG